MPTQKKHTSPKKTTVKKSPRTAARKRKAKKPKVTLSAKKVYLLCGVIVALCAVSLALSVRLTAPKTEKPASAQTVAPVQQPTTAKQPPVKQDLPPAATKTQITPAATQKTLPAPQKTATEPQKTAAQTQKTAAPSTAHASTPAQSQSAKPQVTAASPIAQPNPANAVASAKADKPQQTAQSAKPEKPKPEPKSPFTIPPAQNGATLVFVIDDAGRSVANVRKYTALPFPITIAVLPKLPQSRVCADAIRSAGKEAILHQPMQAMNTRLDPGPGAIKGDMTFAEIGTVIKENLAELGAGIKGMNNHEGSLVTADVIRIGAVLDVCQEMGIYFLDSRTTAETKAPQAALERDMHIFEKAGPYIDNDIDREKMLARIYETLTYANNHGRAIVIGHVDKSVNILPQLLTDIYPYLVQAGYRFATPSQLR